MKKRMKRCAPALVLLVFFFTGIETSYPALSASYVKVIKIAFMNGYATALQLDIEEIRELKESQLLLREKVEKASEKYLDRVREMN